MLRAATARCRGFVHGVRCLSSSSSSSLSSSASSSSSSPSSRRRRVENVSRSRRRDLLFTTKKSNSPAHAAMGQENKTTNDVETVTGIHRINEELAAIRATPGGLPSWLDAISDPVAAKYVVPEKQKEKDKESESDATATAAAAAAPAAADGVVPNPHPETGPWHVHLRIRGPPDSGYDAASYRVRLTFTPRYPFEPPDVHVLSHCHHALVDGDKEVAGLFYHPDNLPPMRVYEAVDPATGENIIAKVEYGLRGLLACVHMFFGRPLKIPGPMDDAHLNHHRKHLLTEWAQAKESNVERERVIAAYVREGAGGGPKDPRLFDDVTGWLPQWMHPDLVAAMHEEEEEEEEEGGETGAGAEKTAEKTATKTKRMKLSVDAARSLCEEVAPGVYTFPLFSEEYCDALIAEVEHFQRSGLPVRRPNSMNNYGVIVNEIGMEPMIDALQRQVMGPVSEALFPAQGGGTLDGHHAFIVQYKQGEDLGLDMHTDDSDVTFNVCLGKEGFTGAGLSFCGVLGGPAHRKLSLVYKHVKGRCVVHLGAQRHGADDIQSGERLNLIVWNHSTLYRYTDAYKWRDVPEETEPPSVECVSYTHDKDYAQYKTYPPGKERFAKTAWYPPKAEQVKMK